MLPLYALFLVPLANAWTFRTTNATDATEIQRGDDSQGCTNATIGKDKLFTWDPEGSNLCISIYRDTECLSRGGYSCPIWRKNASAAFAAFDIMLESEIIAKSKSLASLTATTSSSSSSTTPSSTSAPVASVSASTTPEPSAAITNNADSGSSDSSLSGGAIAGIVIGVIAAVAIMAGFVFLYIKMKNKKNAPLVDEHGGYGPHEVGATGSSVSGTTVAEKSADSTVVRAFRPPPGSRIVELVGDESTAELGSSPISEMDGQTAKRFERV